MNRIRRWIACVLAVWWLPGCSNYVATTPVAPATIRVHDRVILTVVDSTGPHEVRLRDPGATADSVWGIRCTVDMAHRGPSWHCPADHHWSAPMSAVVEMRTKQRNSHATSLVTVVAIGLTAGVIVLLGETVGR